MGDLADADPVAELLAWLKPHPRILAGFGGPEHVTGLVEAPWPHLRVAESDGGTLGNMRWATTGEVQLEAIGHPDGAPGKAALRKLAVVAAVAAAEIVERDVTAGQAVIRDLVATTSTVWSPLPQDQPRYLVTLLVTIQPPRG